jgi:hypothetical protein
VISSPSVSFSLRHHLRNDSRSLTSSFVLVLVTSLRSSLEIYRSLHIWSTSIRPSPYPDCPYRQRATVSFTSIRWGLPCQKSLPFCHEVVIHLLGYARNHIGLCAIPVPSVPPLITDPEAVSEKFPRAFQPLLISATISHDLKWKQALPLPAGEPRMSTGLVTPSEIRSCSGGPTERKAWYTLVTRFDLKARRHDESFYSHTWF